MTDTYRVSGMTCDGCARSVTKAIQAVAPEASVDVDLDNKTVSIEGFGDSAAIAQAVDDAGFEFEGVA